MTEDKRQIEPNGPREPWTGNHAGSCNNAARGGHPDDTNCLISCGCPCHRSWKSRAEYAVLLTAARNHWEAKVQAERSTHAGRGFTSEHDDEHGIDHLLMWAQDYLFRGEPIKAAALIEAAREKLVRDRDVVRYAFAMSAQAWRSGASASRSQLRQVEVVAVDREAANAEARRILGPLRTGYYWNLALIGARDVRVAS